MLSNARNIKSITIVQIFVVLIWYCDNYNINLSHLLYCNNFNINYNFIIIAIPY